MRRALGLTWGDLFTVGSKPPRRPAPPVIPRTQDPELAWAFRAEFDRLARVQERLEEWAPALAFAEHVRGLRRRADLARHYADRLGDTEGAWALRGAAADLERTALDLETAVDG